MFLLCLAIAVFGACESATDAPSDGEPDPPAPPAEPPSPTPTPTPTPTGSVRPVEHPPPDASVTDASADAASADASVADAAPAPKPQPACYLPREQRGYAGRQTFTFGQQNRTYELYVGGNYDGHAKLPLVVVFHGDWMTGAEIRSWMSLEWESGGNAIFIYPDSASGTWDTFTEPATNPDYAFVDQLLADVESKLCVDKKRIFAWGISRGAFFVNHLGCFRGNIFRGVIANSGGGPSSNNPEDRVDNFFICPTPPVSAVVIHGTGDQTIDFSAGDDSQRHWRDANGCKQVSEGIDPGPCVSYTGCKRPVVWCALGGWPHKLWQPSMHLDWTFIDKMNP